VSAASAATARPEVAVEDRHRGARVSRRRIARLAARALALEGAPGGQAAVRLVGDRAIRTLNRRWRGVDRATDVLAFAQREGPGGHLHPELLGDVVIAVPTAARQAREAGHSLAAEIDLLVVHGVLHLLGHEHEGDPAGGRRMRGRQRAILRGWRP
jgi:probable rRNA maturation factor